MICVTLSGKIAFKSAAFDPTVYFNDVKMKNRPSAPNSSKEFLKYWLDGAATSLVEIKDIPDWGLENISKRAQGTSNVEPHPYDHYSFEL